MRIFLNIFAAFSLIMLFISSNEHLTYTIKAVIVLVFIVIYIIVKKRDAKSKASF